MDGAVERDEETTRFGDWGSGIELAEGGGGEARMVG
jgi:hypothetical protein